MRCEVPEFPAKIQDFEKTAFSGKIQRFERREFSAKIQGAVRPLAALPLTPEDILAKMKRARR
jgi:hypothetical protein